MVDLLPTSRLKRLPRRPSCELDGEAVILHLESGTYYGLNKVGARVWELLESPATATEIVDYLVGEYEVDVATCEADVLGLLESMCQAGLVGRSNGKE